jgi:hypothetical protein
MSLVKAVSSLMATQSSMYEQRVDSVNKLANLVEMYSEKSEQIQTSIYATAWSNLSGISRAFLYDTDGVSKEQKGRMVDAVRKLLRQQHRANDVVGSGPGRPCTFTKDGLEEFWGSTGRFFSKPFCRVKMDSDGRWVTVSPGILEFDLGDGDSVTIAVNRMFPLLSLCVNLSVESSDLSYFWKAIEGCLEEPSETYPEKEVNFLVCCFKELAVQLSRRYLRLPSSDMKRNKFLEDYVCVITNILKSVTKMDHTNNPHQSFLTQDHQLMLVGLLLDPVILQMSGKALSSSSVPSPPSENIQ